MVGGCGRSENGAAEQHPVRGHDRFEIVNYPFLLGKAAGKTVEDIVETGTFKLTVQPWKGVEEVMSHESGVVSLEPPRSPGEAAGTVIKQCKRPRFW